jgi:16S rRNA (cytosine967-C5)-methyltransferase
LDAVDSREAYANLLLPRLLADRGITGRDAALATELAYGTLRGQGTYDAVLAACSDRPLGKLDPPVLLALRIGAHQLLATRVGSHAAVATSVDLAKDVAGPRSSGYVNAVLRRVATRDLHEWLPIVAPSPDADRDGYLSVRYSYPRWIVAAYRAALRADPGPADPGPSELEAALAAGNERPRVTMAVTPGAVDREAIMPAGAEPARWSPYGFTLPGGDPARLVAGGHMVVQDEASQLAALLLARAPVAEASGGAAAPVWLDMCAGPGGKARMLHGLATLGGARVVAAEVHPHRARLVASALASWPISSAPPALSPSSPVAGAQAGTPDSSGEQEKEIAARVVVADGRRPAWRDGAFDRVLVDVPCTGLGALRRRPEARWRKSPADLRQLGDLQRALLKSALAAVRPGGVVAYVTCSPVPAETSEVVAGAVADAPGVQILDAPDLLPDVPGLRATADGRYAQFWPHRHGTDAIFIALLRRAA